MRAPLLAVLLAAVACGAAGGQGPRFLVEHAWAGSGEWVAADLHIHTRFSDGAHPVAFMAEKAIEHGCGAIAIVDHADRRLTAATPEYAAAIEDARRAHPGLVVLAGLEWNVPPRGGDEHASVIVPPGAGEWDTLAAFKERFDDYELGERPKPDVREALAWLDGRGEGDRKPVVIYNHPSRKDASPLHNVADLQAWTEAGSVVAAFEGSPGHQGDNPTGSYDYAVKTVDRWDPMVEPDGAWDRLLSSGVFVHGALANSDFHREGGDLNDPWPCAFSETWLRVPEVSTEGVLRAVRAGTFFGVHGGIAERVQLTVSAPGLPREATAGESIAVPAGTEVTAKVTFDVPELDWQGAPNRIDQVEFIVVTAGSVETIRAAVPAGPAASVSAGVPATAGLTVVRARGRRLTPDGPDLLFYTNGVVIHRDR